jgi:hypothetical protein
MVVLGSVHVMMTMLPGYGDKAWPGKQTMFRQSGRSHDCIPAPEGDPIKRGDGTAEWRSSAEDVLP